MSIFNYQELASFLKAQLAQKQLKNSAYSLRSFARDLGVASSSLSDIINRKSKGSEASLHSIFNNLKVSAFEESYLRLMHTAQYASSEASKAKALSEAEKIKETLSIKVLTEKQFLEVASWTTLAVIELLPLSPFKENPDLIADHLKVSLKEIKNSLHTLEKSNLIYKDSSGLFCPHPQAQVFLSKMPSEVAKRLHEDILKFNMESLWTTTTDSRVSVSTLLMIDEEELPEIRNEIQDFLMNLINKQSKKPKRNQLYSLSLHFNPMQRGSKNEMH